MIIFRNNINHLPYQKFKKLHDEAIPADEKIIEAVCISSYSNDLKEVDSRYVNLKIVDADSFIFFSNYNSPKAIQFQSHKQVSLAFYWPSINTQIRMKGNIKISPPEISDQHFLNRSDSKNALAIASFQSKKIDSYQSLINKYESILMQNNLSIRPNYWGGFSFIPYFFEFWEGHKNRLNKRETYELQENKWIHSFLQP